MHLIGQALGMIQRDGCRLDDVRVFIVGQSQSPEYQRLLDNAIAEYQLQDVLVHLPVTDTPEEYFAASDASILYSVLEGLPVVALESLAAGKPVLLSEEANADDTIEDGKTGWVRRLTILQPSLRCCAKSSKRPAPSLR